MVIPPSGAAAAVAAGPASDTTAHAATQQEDRRPRSQKPAVRRTRTLSSLMPPWVITGIIVSILGRPAASVPSIPRTTAGPGRRRGGAAHRSRSNRASSGSDRYRGACAVRPDGGVTGHEFEPLIRWYASAWSGAARSEETMTTSEAGFEFGGVNHLALVCRDMARTVDFYTDVLGMPLIKTIELPAGHGPALLLRLRREVTRWHSSGSPTLPTACPGCRPRPAGPTRAASPAPSAR